MFFHSSSQVMPLILMMPGATQGTALVVIVLLLTILMPLLSDENCVAGARTALQESGKAERVRGAGEVLGVTVLVILVVVFFH